ncbi:50S ribosomal protein L21e [Metallosphaera hakonensis]|uniref:Large ribosomal subunit protein eL21 n=1 Tax=Metallosphaera hakonensis JCM 8857 = DSM 7519 TaxID=1293036 RepID=A0A2U9IX77_9CREN|nr:50S ribosomal protein L21e [Metallosphaera hakonensis]AWS00604.1 50S ribosomal protein L21e [Metallosphaera hakonensis JCM 8857 = DSM 7519]
MVAHSRGNRTRSRKLLRKSPRERGAVPSLGKLMVDLNAGQKVIIKINPSTHSGMPHRRYQGKIGTVIGKRGKSYEVKVKLGDKEKTIIVSPEHMRITNS